MTAHSSAIEERLKVSDEVLLWTHSRLSGLRLPTLPDDKRTQLGSSCLHMAVEHAQAIVVLVHEGLYGSAMALARPLFEAQVRGLWLLYAASDDDVDRAGQDKFPPDFGSMVNALEQIERSPFVGLSKITAGVWKTLCGFTHTGYPQIRARLTADGLGCDYSESDILAVLTWADTHALESLVFFADLAKNEELGKETLARLRRS